MYYELMDYVFIYFYIYIYIYIYRSEVIIID